MTLDILTNYSFREILIVGYGIYTLSELYSYYKHKIMVKNLNDFTVAIAKTTDKQLRETTIDNIIEHDKDSKKFCEHLFYNKISFDNIPRNLLVHSFSTMLFMKNNFTKDEQNEIEKYINKFETRHNVILKNKYDDSIPYIVFGKTKIFTWYKPLFIKLFLYCIKKIFNKWLSKLGFIKQQFPNGYVVWIRICSEVNKLYDPLILFHCSIGGSISYSHLIPKLMVGRTLILSELPGISWENYVYQPPILAEVADNLHSVIMQHGISQYNLLCHSFGGLLCIKYFYRYHNEVKKIICIESAVIVNHAFNIYSEFYDMSVNSKSRDLIQLMCTSITHRDPYIQFYLHRDLSVSDTILLGREEEKNKEIHIILADNDDKIPTHYYSHYIKSKKLPYIVKIFEQRMHGAFLVDKEIQDYVFNVLNGLNTTNL
jgi:pimeloyl-ACP methyl ester carboxylesterase